MNGKWRRSWLAGSIALTAVLLGPVSAFAGAEKVRPAYCAGRWYPAEAGVLREQVDGLLARASPVEVAGKPIALISPHAGYQYSAPVASGAYRCVKGHTFKRVIVLAFSHRAASTYQGVEVPRDLAAYRTPLGEVSIDREVCDHLLKGSAFSSHPDIDRGEHSLELQLPFLQRVLGEFKLVPLLVGKMSTDDYVEAAKAILPWLDDQTLLVVSSDFTHFGARFGYRPFQTELPTKLRELGDQAADPILRCDFDGFADHVNKTGDTICGVRPILLLLRILSMQGGAGGVRAAFDTSGNIVGDWSNSVTYQSFVFTRRPGNLDEQERRTLLDLARRTITAHLNGEEVPKVDADKLSAGVKVKGDCFVTLENHGRLRGCIGHMAAQGPLYEAVIRNAELACHDRRFVHNPVTASEVDELHIEISYLTPMRLIKKPEEIVVGQHGLLIALGGRRGVLLPQVAYERGWTREQFLVQTCGKAGLPEDAWKHPEADIYSFEAEVFGESE
jgi:AmmeMemoRadiSam system protein B/AmmeMemoRadiSam system protein A